MPDDTPAAIHLSDYAPPPYLIDQVELHICLDPEATEVRSRLHMRPNPAARADAAPLILDGEGPKLVSVKLDGIGVAYELMPRSLIIEGVPRHSFTVEIVNSCNPKLNTALSGLYMSGGNYCTQMEAQGFRRMTYFYDRPDIMAKYRVRIEGPKDTCPVLLSNGNPIEQSDIPGTGRHFAVWDDPHPKPSYLFALVAGDLACVTDRFATRSGRDVELRIYVGKGKENRCGWAMQSLKTAMRWDEDAFGREYDLDIFMIVAVSDFNMGAMENKGLNIFNDKYILALPETATDQDYINIEAIIAHEYFHNWTGNRVTCRDWFQLCLKEGLTVFRDQEFTANIRSQAVKRIADVMTLRARQFPEDSGPLAHAVRPASYIEINNFYTATVYEKGAELCRMMKTLIGEAAFRKAMDLYFERHDGHAATVEQFVQCMADASGRDLAPFFAWYEQAGTPEVIASASYSAARKSFDLTLEQRTAPTPGQPDKRPLPIPLGIGLVGPDGNDMPLDLAGTGILNVPLVELNEQKQTFRFRNILHRPALSLNRGFSAPIRLTGNASERDLIFLMSHDSDTFNRWEAMQSVGKKLILDTIAGGRMPDTGEFRAALRLILADRSLDFSYQALMLALPTESEIAAAIGRDVDPDAIHVARDKVRAAIGAGLRGILDDIWNATADNGPYAPDPASTGRRALRYAALQAIAASDPPEGASLAMGQFKRAASMTDEIGTLNTLILLDRPEREEALDAFFAKHKDDHLLVDKWLSLHAMVPLPGTVDRVRELMALPLFKLANPNRVRGLVGAFAMSNQAGFNVRGGEGYRLLADTVIALDPLNPQVAARIATSYRSWRMLEPNRQVLAGRELQRILAAPNLSRDTFEIVSKSAAA